MSIYDPLDQIAEELKYGDILVRFEIRQGKVFKVRVIEKNQAWTVKDLDAAEIDHL